MSGLVFNLVILKWIVTVCSGFVVVTFSMIASLKNMQMIMFILRITFVTSKERMTFRKYLQVCQRQQFLYFTLKFVSK